MTYRKKGARRRVKPSADNSAVFRRAMHNGRGLTRDVCQGAFTRHNIER